MLYSEDFLCIQEMSFGVFCLFILSVYSQNVNEEILPANCHCRDWYGGCRKQGETWTDEVTWQYECSGTDGDDATFLGCMGVGGVKVDEGTNQTIDGFWHSCQRDNIKLKYEHESMCVVDGIIHHVGDEFRIGTFQWLCLDTGRWVTGCYYANETDPNVLLRIGETGNNGLIKHVCDRFVDYPGRVQYYAEVRKDVHVKHPTNKGINTNFPESKQNLIKEKVERWLHENAASFVANGDELKSQVRYLPASRRSWSA